MGFAKLRFPDAEGEAAWRAAVTRVVAKGPANELPRFATDDGVTIAPLYPKAEGPSPQPLRAGAACSIVQRVDHPDAAEANALALADLEGGAAGLTLTFEGAAAARGFGLKAQSAAELERALAGVRLEMISLRLEAAPDGGLAAALAFADLVEGRGMAADLINADFGLDPIGATARHGPGRPWPDEARTLAPGLTALRQRGFATPLFTADGRPYNEAGASEAEELAGMLAAGVAYLRVLEDAKLLDTLRDAVSVTLAADTDAFLTIAKFRAARRLFAAVEASSGLGASALRLHGETAWRALAARDVWTNLLRGTIAAASAMMGGADSVTVLPFTATLGLPDAFARRLARNTGLVLSEESRLDHVADPAAGSGALESLTESLCEKAWALFQEIEAKGGLPQALASGFWQGKLAASRQKRRRDVALRKRPLTGVSIYPDLAETAPPVLFPAPPAKDAARAIAFEALRSQRDAEPFERLRDASDAFLADHSARPKIFLATFGPRAASSARAGFTCGVLEAGGFEVAGGADFADLDELAAACKASGASAACLCASDAAYAEPAAEAGTRAEAVARRLAAVVSHVVLAGQPGALAERLAAAGVEDFLFAGCDVAAFLERLAAGAPTP